MKPGIRHGCLAFVILLSGASFWPDPAAAEILFKADFETGDFRQFSGKSKNIKPGHIEVDTDIVHSGKYSGRFTIHPDNVFNARQLRVQANGPKVTVREGSDTFVSFFMFMKDPPKDRDNFFYWEGSPPPRYNNVMTWWVEPKAGGAGTVIKYGTGNLGRKGVHWEADFTIGRWHQLGMHIRWSEDPARGNVKLWWDGVVILDKKVQTKGPQSVYFSQPGIHRDPHAKSEDTIYFDDFLCATTLEEIAIQKPETARSKGPSPPFTAGEEGQMAAINYLKGDATQPQSRGNKVIAHICNDLGGWGKGFVLAISKRWPEPEASYRSWHRNRAKNDFSLGGLQLVQVEPYIWVANMVAQRGMKTGSNGPPIRYEAVRTCLKKLAVEASALKASVHMPRIGCGLAGGRWDGIEPIINEELTSEGIQVTVYDFD